MNVYSERSECNFHASFMYSLRLYTDGSIYKITSCTLEFSYKNGQARSIHHYIQE